MRDNWLKIDGSDNDVARAAEFFQLLDEGRKQGLVMRTPDFVQLLDTFVVPKTVGQKLYLKAIQKNYRLRHRSRR